MDNLSDEPIIKPIPESYWVGQDLNWEAPWSQVTIWVELPFWLMVSDCSLLIEIHEHEFKVDIRNYFIELFANRIVDSRDTSVYIGPEINKNNAELSKAIKKAKAVVLPRQCKTVLQINSRCNSDVLAATDEENRRSREAYMYLKALCEAHFEVVNRVVQSYRLSTYDYFPYEVSPWDIPVWRVNTSQGFIRVVLLNYAEWDIKPVIFPTMGKSEIYSLIEPLNFQNKVNENAHAGELDLLDALNFMERGDYTDAVRRITTAIEAIVEFVLREELLKLYQEADVNNRLEKLRNDFPSRVRQYEKLSGRKLPSQLHRELETIRNIRHEIVHASRRITFAKRGQAQRAVDIGRWIYNWFENQPDRKQLRETQIGKRSLGRHFSLFNAEISQEGVVVHKPNHVGEN